MFVLRHRERSIPGTHSRAASGSRSWFYISLLGAILIAGTSLAETVIVTANPHKVINGRNRPQLAAIAQDADVHANAYHINSNGKVNTVLNRFPHYGRPKIVSDDAGGYTIVDVERWIGQVAQAGEHYEHFDAPLRDVLGAEAGALINGQNFPANSNRALIRLGQFATPLTPNGKITRSGREFYWNGQPVTLMGFSWMGALVGFNFDIEGYLDKLASHGVNLTRVWAIEQWTALATAAPHLQPGNGVTPFAGDLNNRWNLNALSAAWLARAEEFVRAASDRGIVVQLTLFDRHGLLNESGDFGRFDGSPYNVDNNFSTTLLPAGAVGRAPTGFTGRGTTTIGAVNRRFVNRAVRDLAGYGNVIFEIMNEPLASEWSDVVAWHRWVGDLVRLEAGRNKSIFVDLGTNDFVDGLSRPPTEPTDGDTLKRNRGGRNCRRNLDPATDRFMYFRVDDSIAFQGSLQNVSITVGYFDQGTGILRLQYDGLSSHVTNGGDVVLQNSRTWKTHTFEVNDAYFGNRLPGASDFRIHRNNFLLFFLDVVRVTD